MTRSELEKYIQELQILHSSPYSESLYNTLSIGGCENLMNNSQISYMIKSLYRYWTLPGPLTSFIFLEVDSTTSTSEFTLTLNDVEIVNIDTLLGSVINTTSFITKQITKRSNDTGIFAFEYKNGVIIWSSDDSYSITDDIVLTNVEGETSISTVFKNNLNIEDISIILDTYNCLTYCNILSIKKQLHKLLTNC